MQEAVIIDCLRTAVGKSGRGTLKNTRPDDMAAAVFQGLLKKHPGVPVSEIDDVILGCANPEAESGMNMARVAALRAGFPDTVPGVTINRFCSSGLQAIAMAAEKIRSGGAEIIIAGGSESMSLLPMSGHKFAPNPWMVDHLPQIYMGMGLTAEAVYQKYNVSREDQDAFSYRSHQNALAAQAARKFDDEIVPLEVETTTTQGSKKSSFAKDEGPARGYVNRSARQVATMSSTQPAR
jgi:acetyl-CoA acyltransferase